MHEPGMREAAEAEEQRQDLRSARQKYQELCSADKGKHPFEAIYERGSHAVSQVVRWCPICGAVVIDVDYDGRIAAGRIMPIRNPEISRHSYMAFRAKGKE